MGRTRKLGRLAVHVINGGEGESTILELPDGRWAVVDCYARSLVDDKSNPTLQLLKEWKVPELAFLCITHPHDDHFRGMSQLLRNFPVREFWQFGAMCGDKLKWLVAYFKLSARKKRREAVNESVLEARQNSDELGEIFSLVSDSRRQGKLDEVRVASRLALYPRPVSTTGSFQIWALAPGGNAIAEYEEKLLRCFDDERRLKSEIPDGLHNQISVALRITYGKTSVIIGGDVETEGWEGALADHKAESLKANLVKVSHHGSSNGYCDSLWPLFAASKPPMAVITPYHRHRLPSSEALGHFKKHCELIATTCAIEHVQQGSSAPNPNATKARLVLKTKHEARRFNRPRMVGRCSFVFDDQGNCTSTAFIEPASQLWP